MGERARGREGEWGRWTALWLHARGHVHTPRNIRETVLSVLCIISYTNEDHIKSMCRKVVNAEVCNSPKMAGERERLVRKSRRVDVPRGPLFMTTKAESML